MSQDQALATPRRNFLARVGTATAAALAVVGLREMTPAQAQNGDPAIIGASNEESSATFFHNPTGLGGDWALVGNSAGPNTGVAGQSDSGFGVAGQSDSGEGVRGETGTGIGVHAVVTSSTGTAFKADGKTQFNGRTTFSRSGILTIPAGSSSASQKLSVSASTLILATLQSHELGVHIEAVVKLFGRPPGFTVYLNQSPSSEMPVAWFALG